MPRARWLLAAPALMHIAWAVCTSDRCMYSRSATASR